jgi:hypothetical protein
LTYNNQVNATNYTVAKSFIIILEHKKQSQQLILILNQSVAALSPKCSILSGEVTNTNLTVFGLNNEFAGVYSSHQGLIVQFVFATVWGPVP